MMFDEPRDHLFGPRKKAVPGEPKIAAARAAGVAALGTRKPRPRLRALFPDLTARGAVSARPDPSRRVCSAVLVMRHLANRKRVVGAGRRGTRRQKKPTPALGKSGANESIDRRVQTGARELIPRALLPFSSEDGGVGPDKGQ